MCGSSAAPIPDALFGSALTASFGDISGSTAASAVSDNLYRLGSALNTVVAPLIATTGVGVPNAEEKRAYGAVSGPGCVLLLAFASSAVPPVPAAVASKLLLAAHHDGIPPPPAC